MGFFFLYTPQNASKVTQHDFDRIVFLLSWIFIHQVRYPYKACLFAFRIDSLFVRIVSLGRVKGE